MKGGVYVVTGTELHLPSLVGMQRIRPHTHVTRKKMKVNTNIVCYKDELPVGEKRDGDCLFQYHCRYVLPYVQLKFIRQL